MGKKHDKLQREVADTLKELEAATSCFGIETVSGLPNHIDHDEGLLTGIHIATGAIRETLASKRNYVKDTIKECRKTTGSR